MSESNFPSPQADFLQYINTAYDKASANLTLYGIPDKKLSVITPILNAYITAEAKAANPDTATTGARRDRDEIRKKLEAAWRVFLNENIRYNSAVPTADLEVFGIKKHDPTRTPEGVPDTVPTITIRQVGVGRYEVEVLDSKTGKKKKPQYAAGSNIYLAVTEVNEEPKSESEYRKMEFSSNCHHVLEFPIEQTAKQAHIYARYSNSHGKEGPKGIPEAIIIG
ncbi:MAG: hypothetical protein LBB84_12710 [Tannerellaceae bacterium]|jgi:hypothetical protein|nr:hypothetical protein [Tannerellaceae bacterium]